MDAEQDASPSVVIVALDSDSCGELVTDLDAWHAVPAELATRFYRALRQLS